MELMQSAYNWQGEGISIHSSISSHCDVSVLFIVKPSLQLQMNPLKIGSQFCSQGDDPVELHILMVMQFLPSPKDHINIAV